MRNDQYDILKRMIESVQNSVDVVISDLSTDRKDIDDLKLRQGKIDLSQKQIINKIDSFEKRQKKVIEKAVDVKIHPIEKTLNKFVKDKKKIVVMRNYFTIFEKIGLVFAKTKNELKKELRGGEENE